MSGFVISMAENDGMSVAFISPFSILAKNTGNNLRHPSILTYFSYSTFTFIIYYPSFSPFFFISSFLIDNLQPTIDEYAPLFWVRKDCPPMELIVGDRELELFGRYEENAYLWRMMKLIGNTTTNIYELDGHDHGGMVDPGFNILERFVRNIAK